VRRLQVILHSTHYVTKRRHQAFYKISIRTATWAWKEGEKRHLRKSQQRLDDDAAQEEHRISKTQKRKMWGWTSLLIYFPPKLTSEFQRNSQYSVICSKDSQRENSLQYLHSRIPKFFLRSKGRHGLEWGSQYCKNELSESLPSFPHRTRSTHTEMGRTCRRGIHVIIGSPAQRSDRPHVPVGSFYQLPVLAVR